MTRKKSRQLHSNNSKPISETINGSGEPREIQTVSLFAGCGGMDLGFTGNFTYGGEYYQSLPYNIIKAYDNNAQAVETYKHNISSNIEQLDLTGVESSLLAGAECVIGGFPCQEFSSCGPQGGLESERGKLYKVFVNYMNEHKPLVVIAENVLHLKRMQAGKVLQAIKQDLEQAGPGYNFTIIPLSSADYGVPQSRARLFFIGVRNDLFALLGIPSLPPATHFMNYRTIEWAIQDLVDIIDDSIPNQSQYFKANKAKNGNGQGDEVSRRGELAYTVRANPKSRVQFHYELPRRLTIRECARIQSFPDSFAFLHSATTNIMQIGNAVPPVLAHQVAKSLADYFNRIPLEMRQGFVEQGNILEDESRHPQTRKINELQGSFN